MRLPPKGLYAITAEAVCETPRMLMSAVEAALRGGAVLIQYRDKLNDPATRECNALALQGLCREAGVPLLLNDGPAASVLRLGLDGMHLGLADGDLHQARTLMPKAILGATCGSSLQHAALAVRAGADYLAFGAFHASVSKPEAQPATLAVLEQARKAFTLPLCAIGGITPDNAAPIIAAGADYIAAIGGVFESGYSVAEIEASARRYTELFIG